MKKLRILVIDDEFAALTKMKLMLAPYGDVELAKSGNQALQLIKKSLLNNVYYDLITIDIELPDMNGLEILENIINYEKNYSVMAVKIIITSSGTPENVSNAIERNCNDFMTKPVKKVVLHQKLIKFGLVKED